jgi:predicted nucleic acid-binding protein
MGKRYLLDSNTIIDYVAGLHSGKATQWLNQIIELELISRNTKDFKSILNVVTVNPYAI